MENIRRIIRESFGLVEEKKDPCFCYMLYVDKSDEKDFIDMQKELNLTGELIESGHFHATVRYVKDEDYEPFLEYLKTIELPELSGKCNGFAIYGKEKDTLVIELEGKELHSWFNKIDKWLGENGYPKSDFPTYKPHISLTELAGIKKPEWKEKYNMKVNFKIHVVTKTGYKEVFREKNKDN